MFLKLSLLIVLFWSIRICWSIFLKLVPGAGDRYMVGSLLAFLPPVILHSYYMLWAPFPLIHFSGSTNFISIFLTLLTYIYCRIIILCGSLGLILMILRFLLFWLGLRGGIWSPVIRYSGYVYEFWTGLIPIFIGGMIDIGPLIGLQFYKRITVLFRKVLWCSYPPGILNYDETENKFNINNILLERFHYILRYFMPYPNETHLLNKVFLPFPDNFTMHKSGYLLPFDPVKAHSLNNNFFWLLHNITGNIDTIDELHRYFFDFRLF